MTQTIDPELEELFSDEPAALPPIIVDRSTAERYSTCPAQAVLVERRIVSNESEMAQVGSAVHEILSAAVASRVDGKRPNEIHELIKDLAAKSRPDIQPDVMDACRRTYPIMELLCRHDNGEDRCPDDVMRFDGGAGAQSGQLAFDLIPATETRGAVCITGEVDLLMATASDKEVLLCDWKSGWKHWTAGDVQRSFQFQFYAYLVLCNYPGLQRVTVRVYMTREGGAASDVSFDRSQMYVIGKRIESAVNLCLEWRGKLTGAPAWPEPAKCGICPASLNCPQAHEPEAGFSRDPKAALLRLVVISEVKKRIESGLNEIVRKGIPGVRDPGDIISGKSAYGINKPKKATAKLCSVYQVGGAASED